VNQDVELTEVGDCALNGLIASIGFAEVDLDD